MGMLSRVVFGRVCVGIGVVLSLIGSDSAHSQWLEDRDPKQLVQALRSGGYVILFRHGATFSDQADTDPFNFNDVTKQRNLNQKGKDLAKAFGEAIRQAGIPVGEVLDRKSVV